MYHYANDSCVQQNKCIKNIIHKDRKKEFIKDTKWERLMSLRDQTGDNKAYIIAVPAELQLTNIFRESILEDLSVKIQVPTRYFDVIRSYRGEK